MRFISTIFGLFLASVFSFWIGAVLLALLGVRSPNFIVTAVVGLVGLILFSVLGEVFGRLRRFHASWESCRHGIRGGSARGLCKACIAEASQREAQWLRQKEEEQRREVLREIANKMRAAELTRLLASVVPSLTELRALTPSRFEDEVARMFERLGYRVEQTPYVNDRGRDAILYKHNEKYLVECKRYQEGATSGRPELQKFHSAMVTDKAKKGFFVSTAGFSKDAREFASMVAIELVDSDALLRLMFRSKEGGSENDSYRSICSECGRPVTHSLRAPENETCTNGHSVAPTVTLDDLFGLGPNPRCPNCDSRLRLIKGRRGAFWGCSKYPDCRYTRSAKKPRFR
jgi:DNA-directed RNA polymerase subunit RPC12/RpoP/xanthosine utilization system XapX-like protein